ncbi:histone-like nucleoid-structuring protein Lsr2 [Blastococcus saxobsidens]|uniref:Lsr2 family protein n=1 Tax=Blastococcus saxobsidens (strain DD2) TaxID=1146883 RepID=H6RU76_BLASD|nr:Lsr2 family protein [Blastococcus saxobsidens]CCG05683.1 Protein of unknown function [Blastococcus saxobsidens DD2]
MDDLTGELLPDGQGQTISFALDGTSYEIDLNKDNADALREVFKRYVAAGRKVGRARQVTPRRHRNREDTAAIRAWAWQNGLQVSERGRVPSAIVQAYDAAN